MLLLPAIKVHVGEAGMHAHVLRPIPFLGTVHRFSPMATHIMTEDKVTAFIAPLMSFDVFYMQGKNCCNQH